MKTGLRISTLIAQRGEFFYSLSSNDGSPQLALPDTPPNMPQRGNALTRCVGQTILRVVGWKFSGELPNEKKLIVIGGPHTSNLDFVFAMAAMLAIGLRFSFMMKREAFSGILGGFFKWLGGVSVDRNAAGGVTEQMSNWFEGQDKAWLGITPEGTRSKVDTFKKGYLRIAEATGAPIFVVGINGATKEIILDRIWPLTGDQDADNKAIHHYMMSRFTGIRPENQ